MGGKIAMDKVRQDNLATKIAQDVVSLYDMGGRFRTVELLPDDVLIHVFKMCKEELEKRA